MVQRYQGAARRVGTPNRRGGSAVWLLLGHPLGEQPLRLRGDVVLCLAKEVREFVVLGEPGAPGTRSAALGPGQKGVERNLRIVVRIVLHVLDHPDQFACRFEPGAPVGVSTVGRPSCALFAPLCGRRAA
jgi:hypothetical protein